MNEGERMCAAVALGAILAALPAGAASAASLGRCELYPSVQLGTATTVRAGQLTVAANLPSPNWWIGDTPDSIDDGFEFCLAANIAHRLGLSAVRVVNVSWEALVAGRARDFDLALNEISVTPERSKVVDFSMPYYASDVGLLARRGANVTSANVRGLRIGVQQGSTGAEFVERVLKPTGAVKVFPDAPSLYTALLAGQVDLSLNDTSEVLTVAAASNGRLIVAGQYATGESYAALYPKGSPNAATFNKALKSLIDDGSIRRLSDKYFATAGIAPPGGVPVFTR